MCFICCQKKEYDFQNMVHATKLLIVRQRFLKVYLGVTGTLVWKVWLWFAKRSIKKGSVQLVKFSSRSHTEAMLDFRLVDFTQKTYFMSILRYINEQLFYLEFSNHSNVTERFKLFIQTVFSCNIFFWFWTMYIYCIKQNDEIRNFQWAASASLSQNR